ncbi:latrophilin-3, partial [Biomphalaria glabrata]
MWTIRLRFSKPIKINYTRNKTVSPLDYQVQFCPRRCNNGTLQVIKFEGYFDFECVNCFCQRPACEVYNNCCPDISIPYDPQISLDSVDFNFVRPQNESNVISKHENNNPKLQCDYISYLIGLAYVYISSCKLDYVTNQTVIDLCETEIPLTNETIETYFRVIDLATQVVYKNLFCALCNHIKNYVVPHSNVHTNNLTMILSTTSEYEYFKAFLMINEPYNITFPSSFPDMNCYSLRYSEG